MMRKYLWLSLLLLFTGTTFYCQAQERINQPTKPSGEGVSRDGWQLIGPGGGGRITSITEDPSNPQNLYMTINVGGARRSRDGGITWEIISRGFDYDTKGKNAQSMMSIAVHPKDSAVILAASLTGDIYAWDEPAQEWKLSYRHPYNHAYAQILFDPSAQDTAYLCVGNIQKLLLGVEARRKEEFWSVIKKGPTILRGVLNRSSGQWTWSEVGSIGMINGGSQPRVREGEYLNIYSLDINPAHPQEMFFMTEKGLYKGVLGPDFTIRAFIPVTTGLPNSNDIHGGKIVFDRKDTGTAYLSILNLDNVKEKGEGVGGVYKSTDHGESWTKLKKGLDTQNSNYFDLRIDPKDANIIYAAQFTNEEVGKKGEGKNGKGKKGKDKKRQGQKKEGTLYRSENRGMSWESIIEPSKLEQGWDPWKTFGPDFVQVSKHTTKVWWTVGGGRLMEGEVTSAMPVVWKNLLTRQVGRDRWTTTGSEAIALAKSIAIDPKNSDIVYIPYGDHAYFKSMDGGKSLSVLAGFPQMKESGNAGDSGTLLVDEQWSNVLYAATEGPHQQFVDGGVMYSEDGGKTWNVVGGNTKTKSTLPRGGMTDLLVEYTPGGGRNLYVANYGSKNTHGGVYFLSDVLNKKESVQEKNLRWERIFMPKKGHTRSLAEKDNFTALFVGVDGEGIYKLRKDKTNWNTANMLTPGQSRYFYDLETAPRTQHIYVATEKGFYRIDEKEQVTSITPPQFLQKSSIPEVRAVEIYPQDEDIIYATSERAGIVRSVDRGAHWEEISQNIPTLGFVMLKVDPQRDIIYVEAPGSGVWKKNFGR